MHKRGGDMFLYLYDLIDFDKVGNVTKTNKCEDEKKVISNFIYLVCKYNQYLLHEKSLKTKEKMEIPSFFKDDLEKLLTKLENGKVTKEHALNEVAKSSLPEVKKIIEEARCDREIIDRLNALVDVNSLEFSKKFKGVVNKKQLEYIMTHISAKLMDEIGEILKNEVSDKKVKSVLYKKIISYNGLVNAVTML